MIKWLLVSLSVMPLAVFVYAHASGRRTMFLPGVTSDGHHQIETQCQACHTPFAGVKQEGCLRCHAAGLEAQNDSHAPARFDDPARAAQLARIDARACVTCHREHRPEARVRGSVSVPADFCVGCHAEVVVDRESHRGLATTSCARTACHNYHDNRGLHLDFLRRHRDEPMLKVRGRLPLRAAQARATGVGEPPPLYGVVPDVPVELRGAPAVAAATTAWVGSGHARAGVSCSGCHQAMRSGLVEDTTRPQAWPVERSVCAGCHGAEHAGFLTGKHGMRPAAALTAMTPRQARLPMKPQALDHAVGCTSCHGAHGFDLRRAAAEACEGCHDDPHTRAYRGSRHFQLWADELAGRTLAGTGVSCASCHLPRLPVTTGGAVRIQVQHDQSANLRPADRMAREVCLPCHGLAFSLAALADGALVRSNFQGSPRAPDTGMDLLTKGSP
jgi:predicted CXXCH cytochrome family protein